jgi:hypothetical protein
VESCFYACGGALESGGRSILSRCGAVSAVELKAGIRGLRSPEAADAFEL